MFVGVAGFKPTMTDPNSVVLSVTPYPNVFLKASYCSRESWRSKAYENTIYH